MAALTDGHVTWWMITSGYVTVSISTSGPSAIQRAGLSLGFTGCDRSASQSDYLDAPSAVQMSAIAATGRSWQHY